MLLSMLSLHKAPHPPSYGHSLQIYAWDRCSAGRNASLKESDTGQRRMQERVGCAEAMESGRSL